MPRVGRGAKSDHPADIHEFHQECAKPFLDRELLSSSQVLRASLMAQLPANVAASGSIHGSGRSPREGNGNPLQDSCMRNPTDRGAWRATVHGVAKSWTRLSDNKQPGSWITHYCPLSERFDADVSERFLQNALNLLDHIFVFFFLIK